MFHVSLYFRNADICSRPKWIIEKSGGLDSRKFIGPYSRKLMLRVVVVSELSSLVSLVSSVGKLQKSLC